MKICVSLGTSSPQELLQDIDRAFLEGADLAEIRFDFLTNDEIPIVLAHLKDMKSRCVFTLRPKHEGGHYAGTESERVKMLFQLAREKPALVDVELRTLKENDDLADSLEELETRIVVSWHNFELTPPSEELMNIISEMRVFSNYVKIVTMANSVEDSLRLLDLYRSTEGLQAVIFAMGAAGAVSRILCTLAGNAPFTYASLDKPVAPGQIRLSEMKKLYDRISIPSK